jgi:hypothetical protein
MLIDIEISVTDDKLFFMGTKFQARQLVERIGQKLTTCLVVTIISP